LSRPELEVALFFSATDFVNISFLRGLVPRSRNRASQIAPTFCLAGGYSPGFITRSPAYFRPTFHRTVKLESASGIA
jgi:hypothetical protein